MDTHENTTRLHVDELILDYLLWYCIDSLLKERKLRQDGLIGKQEWIEASKSADMGMRLVNCLNPSTSTDFAIHSANQQPRGKKKHSSKPSNDFIQTPRYRTASHCVCDCVDSPPCSSADSMLHPPILCRAAHLRAHRYGSLGVAYPTSCLSPTPAAPTISSTRSLRARRHSRKATSILTSWKCAARWGLLPYHPRSRHFGARMR